MIELPPCCHASPFDEPAHIADAAYNAAGDPGTAGLNYQGKPCPTWNELPENIRQKWRAAVEAVAPIGSYGWAVAALKRGERVCRAGWNGKGMWLHLQVPDAHSKMQQPYIYMSPVDGRLVPWLASQSDMLADDWMIVD